MHPFDFATPEIRMLWASALLGLVQLAIAFLFSIGVRGMPWALGALLVGIVLGRSPIARKAATWIAAAVATRTAKHTVKQFVAGHKRKSGWFSAVRANGRC